jgi:5-methylthioadenosine/S-adenosylhomocysteine deaminase
VTDAGTEAVDLALTGATVVTANERDDVVADAVLGIRGDRIAWLAPAGRAPRAWSARRTIALPGRVIVPGFVNAHVHSGLSMVRGVAEDLGTAPSYTPGIPHAHEIGAEEARAFSRLGALEALLFGCTLINDSFVHAEATVAGMAELGLRVTTCNRIHDADFGRVADGVWVHEPAIGEATLGAAVALAERWHGKAEGRIGVQLAAHAPDTCSAGLLRRVGEESRRLGLRVNTHLAEGLARARRVKEREGLSEVELLEDAGLLDDRLLAAHCIHLSAAEMAKLARAGVAAVHVPQGNACAGAMAPTSALRRAGVRLALGTDHLHTDMIEVMRWAVAAGRLQEGGVSDFWQPRHALRMATIEGARAMGLERDIGSLEAGKKADLVAVDFRRPHLTPATDPLGTLVHAGQGRDVELVIVDGRVVVEDGRPTLVDGEAVRRDAAAVAEALWRRARASA